MKYLIYFFIILLILLPLTVLAQGLINKRIIEEEKKDSFRLNESRLREEDIASQHGLPKHDYFKKLLSKEKATLFDAYTMLVILMGLEGRYTDFKVKRKFLIELNIVPKRISLIENSNQLLDKGVLAYMLCKALKIKGGLWLRLFGVTERYAFRELIFKDIMLKGNTRDVVSGKELVFAIIQAADYLAQKYPLGESKSFSKKTEIKK